MIPVFGFLNLDKPAGITSRDVVNRVQRIVRPLKVGHAGTLDPLATGVLVVCLGQATRLVDFVQRYPKRYDATFLLGRSSDTEDLEGEVVEQPDAPLVTVAQIESVLPRFTGEIQQIPPAFSALKVAGRRAYTLARRGETVTLAARLVTIHTVRLAELEYPRLRLDITCGSGTYVRSLGRDIARAVGTEAVMSALRRTEIGPFTAADALDFESLTPTVVARKLASPLLGLQGFPRRVVSADEERRLRNGLTIAEAAAEAGEAVRGVPPRQGGATWQGGATGEPIYSAVNLAGDLVALLGPGVAGELRPILVFPQDRATA